MRLRTLLMAGIVIALALCVYKFWPSEKKEPLRSSSVTSSADNGDKASKRLVIYMEKSQPAAIKGSFVVIANKGDDFDAFIEAAQKASVDVQGTVPEIGLALVSAKDKKEIEVVASCIPPRATIEYNFEAFTPDLAAAPTDGYEAFGSSPGEALGCPDDVNWGKGIALALLDMKVTPHQSLASASIVQYSDPLVQASGTGMHATQMASIICGRGEEIAGIAPSSQLLNFIVSGDDGLSSSFSLAKGIVEAVKSGASVICVELATSADSRAVKLAVAYAKDNNALLVAPSGENGETLYPAAIDEVLSVGAVDAQATIMSRNVCDIYAPGAGITAASTGNKTGMVSGSGSSAVIVSGIVAGLMYENQGLTSFDAGELLTAYADKSGLDSDDGRGIVNVDRVRMRTASGLRDIAITGVTISPNADSGRSVRVAVQNKGTATTGFTLEVVIDGKAFRFNNAGLSANKFEVYAFDAPSGSGELSASVTTQGDDSNPDNNVW